MKVFKDLSSSYNILYTKDIHTSFLKYKSVHLDKLEFLDNNLILLYKHAFFYVYHKMRVSKKKFSSGFKYEIFLKCLEEVSSNFIKEEDKVEEEDDSEKYICNLYRIS